MAQGGFSLADLNRYYAMIICRMSGGTRMRIYRKLISLLHNRFSLMDALDRIRGIITNDGRNPDEPMALALLYWQRSLQNGNSFSVALEGWAPARERLMLSVGDVSNLAGALENLIKVTEGTKRMTAPLVGALAYPMFLSMMTVAIIYARTWSRRWSPPRRTPVGRVRQKTWSICRTGFRKTGFSRFRSCRRSSSLFFLRYRIGKAIRALLSKGYRPGRCTGSSSA